MGRSPEAAATISLPRTFESRRRSSCRVGVSTDNETELGDIRIGISGWRYPPWRGMFYPPGLPQRRELEYASRHVLDDRDQRLVLLAAAPRALRAVARRDAGRLHFQRQGPRFITHMLKLRNSEQALANFFASGIANLGDKLGPILWQLPPTFRFDRERLAHFLALAAARYRRSRGARAPAQRQGRRPRARSHSVRAGRCAMRSRSGTRRSSTRRSSTCCAASASHWSSPTPPGKWPYAEDVTADFVYVRLHGDEELYVSGYTDAALARWAERFVAWSAGGAPRRRRAASRIPGRHPARGATFSATLTTTPR